jgi:hypothetical protein
MGYSLRLIDVESKFSRELNMDVLHRLVPRELIADVLHETGVSTGRVRKLNLIVVVQVVIAMGLYARLSIGTVLQEIARGLRFIWAGPDCAVAGESAIAYRRLQLGVEPLEALFHRVCQPLATPATIGAFLYGARVMAIDGTVEDVPDTPQNAAAFGRHGSDRGPAAFPQLRAVHLVECGTHAIIDTDIAACHVGEHEGARALWRSIQPGMLITCDRGLYSAALLGAVVRRHAHLLARLSRRVSPQFVRSLPDGSWLGYVSCPGPRRGRRERILVRIIEYVLTNPETLVSSEPSRLLTTLVDPELYPARELVCAYHQRWEVELTIDEVDTHQRLANHPLRSLSPDGVRQEFYGLLIAHYAIRSLMHEAACQAGIAPLRLSFVHALHILVRAIPEFQMVARDELDHLYARLLQDIAAGRLPMRRVRSNPRAVKRKMSKFPLKRTEHDDDAPSTCSFAEMVVLI